MHLTPRPHSWAEHRNIHLKSPKKPGNFERDLLLWDMIVNAHSLIIQDHSADIRVMAADLPQDFSSTVD
ncbi:hypothetical protein J4E08_23420 [Sagittula sp. NFXS13]